MIGCNSTAKEIEMDFENTMNMDPLDWEFNCARSWQSHILQLEDAAYLALDDDEHPTRELNF